MDADTLNNSNEKGAVGKTGYKKYVLIGLVATVLAWVLLKFCAWGSITFALAGVVLCAIGCKVPRGALRNWSITGIIASAVLIVVFATFWFVIRIL